VIVAEVIYLFDQIAVKLALATFFLRIVREHWQRRVIQISASIYTFYALGFSIFAIFQCRLPTAVNFEFPVHCQPWRIIGTLNYIAAINNCIIDWILVAMPIYTVSRVQMSPRAKFSACGLILFGLVGSLISLARIPLVPGLKLTGTLNNFHIINPIALCSLSESGIGIIAMSLAALRPLVSRAQDAYATGRSRPTTANNTYNNTVRQGSLLGSRNKSLAVGTSSMQDDDDKMGSAYDEEKAPSGILSTVITSVTYETTERR